jgi:hypothetical protein
MAGSNAGAADAGLDEADGGPEDAGLAEDGGPAGEGEPDGGRVDAG